MKFEPFSLEHKKEFDRIFREQKLLSADSTFTNLALWKFDREIEVAFNSDFLVVKQHFKDQDLPNFLFPVGDGNLEQVINKLKNSFEKVIFRAVNNEQKEQLSAIAQCEATPTPENSDYLYSVQDLIDLKGRAYHAKKNFVNRFVTKFRTDYENLNSSNQEELLSFIKNWFANAPYKNDAEEQGILGFVKNFELFNARVGILRADEKIAAFTVSEELSPEMVVVHIEKADPSFAGSYQSINKIHLESEWSGKKIVNREEDLGIEGLRKAKLSYHPIGYVDKFRVVLN